MNDERQSEYDRIVRPIERRMMLAIWRIVRDPDEADDAFQQAVETIWKRWPKVRRHANPPALVMTICVHAAYDALRRRRRRAGHEFSDESLDRRPATRPGPDRLAEAEQTSLAIHEAIGRLPAMQRATITLRLIAELSFAAIAQALGCSEATARTHCLRAMRRLRPELAHLRSEGRNEVQP